MVQAVAKFVEEGCYLLMGEAGLFVADRRGEVADEVGDRQLQRVAVGKAGNGAVHPRAAAFFRARIGVKVEVGAQLSVGVNHVVAARVGVPGGKRRVFAEAHAEEAFADGEQPLQHLADGEVGAQVFLREGVFALPLFFGGVGDVPRLQFGQIELARGVVA